jgi:hypothetical protein
MRAFLQISVQQHLKLCLQWQNDVPKTPVRVAVVVLLASKNDSTTNVSNHTCAALPNEARAATIAVAGLFESNNVNVNGALTWLASNVIRYVAKIFISKQRLSFTAMDHLRKRFVVVRTNAKTQLSLNIEINRKT